MSTEVNIGYPTLTQYKQFETENTTYEIKYSDDLIFLSVGVPKPHHDESLFYIGYIGYFPQKQTFCLYNYYINEGKTLEINNLVQLYITLAEYNVNIPEDILQEFFNVVNNPNILYKTNSI